MRAYPLLTIMSSADSELVYVRVPMQDIVLLGSMRVVTDLLDKRSQKYSDRKQSVVWSM